MRRLTIHKKGTQFEHFTSRKFKFPFGPHIQMQRKQFVNNNIHSGMWEWDGGRRVKGDESTVQTSIFETLSHAPTEIWSKGCGFFKSFRPAVHFFPYISSEWGNETSTWKLGMLAVLNLAKWQSITITLPSRHIYRIITYRLKKKRSVYELCVVVVDPGFNLALRRITIAVMWGATLTSFTWGSLRFRWVLTSNCLVDARWHRWTLKHWTYHASCPNIFNFRILSLRCRSALRLSWTIYGNLIHSTNILLVSSITLYGRNHLRLS